MGPTSWAYTTCDSIKWEEERKKRSNKEEKERIGEKWEWKNERIERKRLSCGLKREWKKMTVYRIDHQHEKYTEYQKSDKE